MNISATRSALDVAYWFFDRAEKDHICLEAEKLQHLLFLAQHRYASAQGEMLMPCVFMCDEQGFFEPTLKTIFAQGIPLRQRVRFDAQISQLLEKIWSDFSMLSIHSCQKIIKQMPLYLHCYRQGVITVVSWNSLIDNSKDCVTICADVSQPKFHKKVLLSQNGPVVVSQWSPRKINNKDYIHE